MNASYCGSPDEEPSEVREPRSELRHPRADVNYLPTKHVAHAVGVRPRILVAWFRNGRVTAAWRLPGGQYRWDLEELKRQLDSNKHA